jgi:hypothetical protein
MIHAPNPRPCLRRGSRHLRIVHAESDDDDARVKVEHLIAERLHVSEDAEVLAFVSSVGPLLTEPRRHSARIRLLLADGHPERPRIADTRDAHGRWRPDARHLDPTEAGRIDPDIPCRVGSELLRNGGNEATQESDAILLVADRAEHLDVRALDVGRVLPDQSAVSAARRARMGSVRSRRRVRTAGARPGPSNCARSTRPAAGLRAAERR